MPILNRFANFDVGKESQLGFDVTRTHYENSIANKLLLCFVSSILRSKVQNACKSLHYDTNRMLMEIDWISLCLVEGDVYIAIHDESRRQKELLAAVGVLPADMDAIAEEYNMRKGPISSQYRNLPKHGAQEKPKRGRPKGSKSKKNLEREREMAEPAKSKPGRPRGRRNKANRNKI